ncbi:SusC/RagA family TonB-linked outer membrane protein [Mucilaginibacter ginsenosidivorax]|uniref:TonB-dependent receptor n=1 Tax=Mucilaginibacter ginsenosidivorax TaxID=862126 RepID=A0A5B8VVA1_9SPHI|nr:TonB-dependent receptor [Mucilaginibacter ginsenosidivorax]QEC75203.1 TonB-dependent receptor [Mucilaginibacter ginsenosidivorax]
MQHFTYPPLKKGILIWKVITSLLLVITPILLFAQTKPISGIVKDENGHNLAYATVTLKGGGQATQTDSSGRFSIAVAPGSVLIFSAVGYEKSQLTIGSKNQYVIVLNSLTGQLGEVMVVGYGTQKKSDLTGSVSRVKGEDLKLLPTQRVDQALQGRAPGVSIQNTDGSPGGNTVIRIRGSNSINGDNSALVVIDGLQGGNLNSLNPNDIASIEILKDASATAIYGSQGANGVILVTTKLGKPGKAIINYTFDGSIANLNNKPKLLNAADYAREINKVRLAQNGNGAQPQPIFSDTEIQAFQKNGGTDWVDQVYRTAYTQNHQVSVSGAGEKISYLLSGAYLNQQGILINSGYDRYSIRANFKGDITKWVGFGVNLSTSKEKSNSALFGGSINYPANPVIAAPRFSPTIPVYDASGNYSAAALRYANPTLWNPVASAREPIINNGVIRNNINAYLEFKLLEGLTLKVTGGAILTNVNNYSFYNNKTFSGFLLNGSGNIFTDNNSYFQNSNILTYDKTIHKSHFTITAVAEQKYTKDLNSTINANDFAVQQTGIFDVGGAKTLTTASNTYERVINSYLGRVNYIFDNKYLLTASVRADGSSVFGNDNKWGYFPSGSIAWKASEEQFIKKLNIFSDLKFRVSYGVTGNQAINPYQTLAHITSGYNYPYFGTDVNNLGYSITSTANPKLKWEKTAQTDAGVDVAILNRRLELTFDYYNKLTTDLLLPRVLPTYSGLSTILDNVGSIRNRGIEFGISGDPFVGKFSWNTGVTFSANRATVVDLGGIDRIAFASGGTGGQGVGSSFMYLVKGQPYGQMIGYGYKGVWKTSEAAAAAKYGQLPGDPHYDDVNNDGVINANDEKVIGNSMPKFIFGWTNKFSYAHFDLNFLVQGAHGNSIFDISRIALESPGGTSADLLNRWSPGNENSSIPAIIDQATRASAGLVNKVKIPGASANRNSRWVEDGSYVRLKNITLGYNLPAGIAQRIHVSNLRIYVSGTNLITITKYKGSDPEVSSYTGNDAQFGSDFGTYPQSKIYNIGLNVSL